MSEHDPADCWWCSDRATGIGIGFTTPRDKDPRWLCMSCVPLAEDIRRIKRPDSYKLKARYGGMDAAGEYLSSLGKTDLADFEEEEALMLIGAIIDGYSARLRQLVRDDSAPF